MASHAISRVVLGGGISGLLAARRAARVHESITLISETIGGQIQSEKIAGVPIDVGAEAFSIASPEVLELVRELGLEGRIVMPIPEPARIITNRGTKILPSGFFGIPADLDDPALQAYFEPEEIAEAKHRDSLPFGSYPSVEDLIVCRLGRPFLDQLVEPVMYGVHGSSAKSLSSDLVLPALMTAARRLGSLTKAVSTLHTIEAAPGSRVRSIRGGMTQLIEALVRSLPPHVQILNAPVTSISRRDGFWQVKAGDEVFSAIHLTAAVPAHALSTLFFEEPSIAGAASEINQVSVDVVLVHVKSAELDKKPLGPGALVSSSAGYRAKATTHVNAKWQWIDDLLPPEEHIIRLSVGRDGDVTDLGDLSWVESEVAKLYSCSVEVIETFVQRWDRAMVQPDSKAIGRLKSAAEAYEGEGLELASGFTAGNGILAIVRDNIKRERK